MKNLAELQYTSTSDTTTQHTISKQVYVKLWPCIQALEDGGEIQK